jgi:DNA-binding CsgD family transcriptional regulator
LATIRGAGEWDSWNALTEAERRIADLAISGLTNRRIAEQLTVSHHTVDAHLQHIFTKLGIHSRADLTVIALRQGHAASELDTPFTGCNSRAVPQP